MRLKYQLFVTFVLFSMLLVTLLAVLNSWSFNRGFTNYVVDIERQRLEGLGNRIAATYEQKKDWNWLRDNPGIFRSMAQGGNPAPRQRGNDAEFIDELPGRFRQRLVLVDEKHKLLIGRGVPERNVVWVPIESGGSPIAYFGIREPRGLPGELEDLFIARQLKNYVFAAVATVILSALLAIALASRLVKPILKVNAAVNHMIGGEYSHRIDINRKDELGDVGRNINQMAFTLEKNQSARQQWMAEISHELRTPVAVLQGELEAIQDGVNKADSEAIDSLHAETVRLGLLIGDLRELTLSDVGALNYKMEPVDVAKIVEQRLNLAKSMVTQAQLSVETKTNGNNSTIVGDAQRLAQLIDNLLQNSVRYTDQGGNIEITISSQNNRLTLIWQDSTPGVNDDQLPSLFDLLYRADESRSREHGGSGLGLAIVKKIVLAHQGSVGARHSEFGGLSIQVELPQ